MKKQKLFILILFAIVFANEKLVAQPNFTPADPEYYTMDRDNILFDVVDNGGNVVEQETRVQFKEVLAIGVTFSY